MTLYKKLLFIPLLFICTTALAAPSISGITGTANDGNDLTITGSNFGTKSGGTAPLVWETFEGGVDGDDLGNVGESRNGISWNTSYGGGSPNVATKYTDVVVKNGSLSARSSFQGNQWNCTAWLDFGNESAAFVSYYTYRINNAGERSRNVKHGRMSSNYNGWEDGDPILRLTVFDAYNSGGNRESCTYGANVDSNISYAGYFGHWQSLETWWKHEMYGQASSSPGAADGDMMQWVNFSARVNQRNVITHTNNSEGDYYRYFALPYYVSHELKKSGDSSYKYYQTDYYIYYDDVYIDDTEARVEIRNEAGTVREIQPAHDTTPDGDGWDNEEIVIKVNQGSFANDSNAKLVVIDADGNESNEYDITFGGGYSEPILKDVSISGVSPTDIDNGDTLDGTATGLGAVEGNAYIVNLDGDLTVSQTVVVWADTSFQLTVVQGGHSDGDNAELVLQHDDGRFSNVVPVTFSVVEGPTPVYLDKTFDITGVSATINITGNATITIKQQE